MEKPPAYIFKFGGSCLVSRESFGQAAHIIDQYFVNLGRSLPLVCVCSAFNGITNRLIDFEQKSGQGETGKEAAKAIVAGIVEEHLRYVQEIFPPESPLGDLGRDYVTDCANQLERLGETIRVNTLLPALSDQVRAFGERMSSYLFHLFLRHRGNQATFISPDDNFLITNEESLNALPILDECDIQIKTRVEAEFAQGNIVVVPGYYGISKTGKITTLGRGGTDFTATIVGHAIAGGQDPRQVHVVFWKDVSGILSAPPKYIPDAALISQISYAEAREMSFFGSKVLHPLCLKTAEMRHLIIELRNFDAPFAEEFTRIVPKAIIPRRSHEFIKAITCVERLAMVTVLSDAFISLPGTIAKIFKHLADNQILIYFISQSSSENNVTFGVAEDDGRQVVQILRSSPHFKQDWTEILLEEDNALVTVVGAGMQYKIGVAGLLFTTLGNDGINIRAISQGSSEMNITIVIKRTDLDRTIRTIYDGAIMGNLPERVARW
jgi:aspartate kinase